ncbi:MAG: aldo/keto reductase [Clostridia bacterium]|nr:aldo/keto reductase [Clostridia bacterium]
MQYVPFGKLGFDISRLGLGCMRLPMTEQDGQKAVDVPRAIALIRAAIDGGVTYIDTAYPYHGGESENIVGQALRDGYRERVRLATKLPVWKVETRADMDKLLDEQLKKLQVSHVDFYLLHALSRQRWEKVKALGALEFLDSAVKDGRIRYPSFSFHDEYDVFEDIMNGYDWCMAQIQYNYLDINHQAGDRGIALARKRGVPLVIMEPLRGGALAKPSADIQAIMDAYPEKHSPVDWAFRFVGNEEQVATILSGMSNEEQLDDNLRIFEDVRVGALSESDKKLIADLREAYRRRMPIGCTGCEYCLPCPKGVAIPRNFRTYNEFNMFDKLAEFPRRYQDFVRDSAEAGRCVKCGACEKQCPQHLRIRDWLQTVHKAGTADT